MSYVTMTCSVCKGKTRNDGFCIKCRQKTGVADISIPTRNRKSYIEGKQNEFKELTKQRQWLQHKIDTAKSPEKKKKAERQLEDWKKSKGGRYDYLQRVLDQMREFA